MVAAVVFLAAYAWPILQPSLDPAWQHLCWIVNWLTWAAFGVDYVVRVVLVPDRGAFIRHHVLDLCLVVLPMLRPLRLLRLVTLFQVLNRKASSSLRGRIAVYVTGATTLVIFIAALAALNTERGAEGANLTTFSDSWWWAIETITTVGYGDRYPVTLTGRLIAVGLMIAGIALLGIITASLASWLVEKVRLPGEDAHKAAVQTDREVEELTVQVRRLQGRLDLVLDRLDQTHVVSWGGDGRPPPDAPAE